MDNCETNIGSASVSSQTSAGTPTATGAGSHSSQDYGQDQWTTVSSPTASVIIQERKIPDALQKAIQESIDMGKKAHRAG